MDHLILLMLSGYILVVLQFGSFKNFMYIRENSCNSTKSSKISKEALLKSMLQE